MPWVDNNQAFDYRLLQSGALEFRDRSGRYQLVWGCNGKGWHEFWERLDLIRELLGQVPEDSTIEQVYLEHSDFRRHCDRCLELSGIDPDTVAPRLMRWLLFPSTESEASPLIQLNTPYPAKHPPLLGGEPLSGRVELLAALASVCDGNMADAVALASSTAARDLFAAMESRAWALADQDAKDKALLANEKKKAGAAMGLPSRRNRRAKADG
jgi:hypothetical protein